VKKGTHSDAHPSFCCCCCFQGSPYSFLGVDDTLALYRGLTQQHTVSCDGSNETCSVSRVFADSCRLQHLHQAEAHSNSACSSCDPTQDTPQLAAQSCSIRSCLLLPVFDRQGGSPVAIFELASGAADLDWEVTGDCLSHAAQVGEQQVARR
jgi:hypothetical protein